MQDALFRWVAPDQPQRVQVSAAAHADQMVKLGVSKAVGLVLIFLWLAVLVVTIVLRRHTSYEARKELHWWEAFYRTGSIIFGSGQVRSLGSHAEGLPMTLQAHWALAV